MNKKDLLYIAGGALLLLIGIQPYILRLLTPEVQKVGQIGNIITIITGLILIAKAFVKDMIPEIALVGLFGVLAIISGISFLQGFIALFREGPFIVKIINVCSPALTLAAYGAMAAIILLKDSFGSFFFVPAGAVAVKAVLAFIGRFMAIGGMPIGAGLMIFVFDMILVGALFAVGMAVNEN